MAGFGGGSFDNTGFQVTYGGTLGLVNVSVLLDVQDFTAGASGFTGETDKGGAVDNQGTVSATGNHPPVVTVPGPYTIPLRTPFALTGNATDQDGDTIYYSWEQNDAGASSGTSLLINTKTNGPLFAMFNKSAPVTEEDTLLYNSPHENHVTTSPTRVFPDLEQVLANNTNADTGACTSGPIAPPVPIPAKECFSEFLPTSDYTPTLLHFRMTARDLHVGGGGNTFGDVTLTLAPNAGPFRVTSPNTPVTYGGGSTQTVTWDKANTDLPPTSTSNVAISMSDDGGLTYPYVLAASTANDGSEDVTIPDISTTTARVKIEAVGNIFFDVSNTDFTVRRAAATTTTATATTTSTSSTASTASATTASATSATSATTSATSSAASSASSADPLPRPARARAQARSGEDEDPSSTLLGRTGAARTLEALAPGTRGQADPAAGLAQAPRLPGQPGGRQEVGTRQPPRRVDR